MSRLASAYKFYLFIILAYSAGDYSGGGGGYSAQTQYSMPPPPVSGSGNYGAGQQGGYGQSYSAPNTQQEWNSSSSAGKLINNLSPNPYCSDSTDSFYNNTYYRLRLNQILHSWVNSHATLIHSFRNRRHLINPNMTHQSSRAQKRATSMECPIANKKHPFGNKTIF